MGFRLQRRVTIAPGLTMNISKRGLGMSVGPRGAKISVGPRGTRESVGIPGTGMRYEVRQDRKKASPSASPRPAQPPAAAAVTAAGLGFFAKAFKEPFEKEFIEGARCLARGDNAGAIPHFRGAAALNPDCVDAEFLTALTFVNDKDLDSAASCLEAVVSSGATDFPLINKYMGREALQFELPVTDEVAVTLHFDVSAAYLVLVEVYQQQGRTQDAVKSIREAMARGYTGPVMTLSLAELLNDLELDDEIIAIAQGAENTDDVTVAILFYLGQAMMRKAYYDAAVVVLKSALAKRKDRTESLLMDVRYVLAQVYEKSGKKAMARKQYEQLLAKDISYRDVREKVAELAPGS